MKNLAKKLGVKFTDSMWCELDQDGVDSKDGKVTFPEFVVSISKNWRRSLRLPLSRSMLLNFGLFSRPGSMTAKLLNGASSAWL
eukprot:SAG31_NODE_451_length_15511_cov_77.547301_4_plen_84_part_00